MTDVTARFPGHQRGHLAPSKALGSGSNQMLFVFDSEPRLQVWTRSDERRGWLERMADVTCGDDAWCVLTGHETGFTLPATPPCDKMAIVSRLALSEVDHKPCEGGLRRHAFATNQEKP